MKSASEKGYFITGTDTEIGKTLVSVLVMQKLKSVFSTVLGFKPVVAGLSEIDGSLRNEDVVVLQKFGSIPTSEKEVCPYRLRDAIAPHLAAKKEKVSLSLDVMIQGFDAMQRKSDMIVVEGVGGFLVPLNSNSDTATFSIAIGLPVILVVGMRLGCLNHAMLTAEAIQSRGLRLVGWVANCVEAAMETDVLEGNIETLTHSIDAPRLGVIPFIHGLKTPYKVDDVIPLQNIIKI